MHLLPEIVVPTVDVSLPLEAGCLVFQLTAALHALQARGVPLPLHRTQVKLVRDAQPAARAQWRLPALLTALHLQQAHARSDGVRYSRVGKCFCLVKNKITLGT